MKVTMKKSFLTVWLLLVGICLSIGLIMTGSVTYAAVADGSENIVSYTDENGVDRMAFDIVHGYSAEQGVSVRVLGSLLPQSGVSIVGIVLLSVGAAGLVGSLIWLILKKGKKLAMQIAAVCLSGVIVVGGILGFVLAPSGKPLEQAAYRYFGAEASENAAPDPTNGYTEEISTRKILSDFEFGLESRYDRIHSEARRFWNTTEPMYDYTAVQLPSDKEEMMLIGSTEGEADNSNYWYVLPAQDSKQLGSATVEYRLDHWSAGNYLAIELYDCFRVIFSAVNPDSEEVNLTVSVKAMVDDELKEYELGGYQGKSGDKVELVFDTCVIPMEARESLARICFTTKNESIGRSKDGSSYQRNDVYYMEFLASQTAIVRNEIAGIGLESKYLGTVTPTRYGAYSGTGFYDEEDGKWKMWFGGGIPEGISSDNVWYIESEDPRLGWSQQYRVKLNDPNRILHNFNASPGYGGDPTMIKVDGTYYMYFSGIPREYEGIEGYGYNQVYLATSKDGLNFDLREEPIVKGSPFDGHGSYGAGAPTICYVDGTYYMYYFTTTPLEPDNNIGCVRRTSTDGIHFSAAEAVYTGDGGLADVKYLPELKKWIAIDSPERSNGAAVDTILRLGFSDDGIHFTFGSDPFQRPAQNLSKGWQNHSAAFFGNQHGIGYMTMFYTYAANDIPVRSQLHNIEMDFREFEWSVLTIEGAI